MTQIYYLGRNDTDLTVSFAIGRDRWEYFLPTKGALDVVEFLAKRWQGKGLAWAKKHATREEKLQ